MQDMLKNAAIGDTLPPLELPPVTRTTLALFAGASGDHNPIHIDIDVAKQAGMEDVFAQGMLSMAYLGRLLTDFVPQARLRGFSSRFSAITRLGDRLTATGEVVAEDVVNGEPVFRLALKLADQNGEVKISGEALVAAN